MPHKPITVVYIHGWMTFSNRAKYLKYLRTVSLMLEKKVRRHGAGFDEALGKHYKVIRPLMPSPDNARYDDWALYFKRYLPHLHGKVILIWGSLWGIFLAKYLSEHTLTKKVLATFLVCPPFDESDSKDELCSWFKLKSNLSRIEKNTKHLTLLFSEDDDVVPISHAAKYQQKLPRANIVTYKNKNGHFKVSEFPELIKMIKRIVKHDGHHKHHHKK